MSQRTNEIFKKGDYRGAIDALDKAISVKSSNSIAYNLKGAVYLKLEKYNEAIACYNEALRISPKNFDALKDKGLALFKLISIRL